MDRSSMYSTGEPLPLYSEVDDGRISLDVDSGLFRTLSRLIPSSERDSKRPHRQPGTGDSGTDSGADQLPPPPAYQYRPGAPIGLKLNIVMQVVGSRGDVQPFVALGVELQKRHGHRVRLATHDVFRSFVQEAGLEFYPIGGDPTELMAYMVKNPGLLPSMSSVRAGDVQKKRRMMSAILDGCWQSCISPDPEDVGRGGRGEPLWPRPFTADAIIANPPSFAHVHCAQALGIPVHLMFTMPWFSTRAFAHPLVNLTIRGSSVSARQANYMSYYAVEWMTWQGLGDLVNTWRESLDLEAIPIAEGPSLVKHLKVPMTYCWSPSLVPKPADWPSYIDVCGFFFRDPPDYTPDPQLKEFLSRGPRPVYIGFGSIVVDDAAKLTHTLVDAVHKAGCRAIISAGWSKLGGEGSSSTDDIFWLVSDCPHEYLFQHVSAVVHHGGSGTTACGLRNGRPTIVVPFFGDQPFWGEMVAQAGAGPTPIPHRRLTSDNLAEGIKFCLTDAAAAAAASVATRMKTEFGIQQAVESFHAHLPVDDMRCDIIPDRPATWIYKAPSRKGKATDSGPNSSNTSMISTEEKEKNRQNYMTNLGKSSTRRIKLSNMAANVLVENGQIAWGDLSRHRPKPFIVEIERWEPVSALSSSFLGTTLDVTASAKDIVLPIKSYQRIAAARKREKERAENSSGGAAGIASAASASASIRSSTSEVDLNRDLPPRPSSAQPAMDRTASEPVMPSAASAASASSSSNGFLDPNQHNIPLRKSPSARSADDAKPPPSLNKELAYAVRDSAAGVGGLVGSFYKGFILDVPLAVTEGFRAVPRLYGEDVPAHKPITDWRSGMDVAGDNFYNGVYRGLTGLVREPVEGARKEGALGAVKGYGRGLANMVTGVPSGFLGLISYSGQGLYQTTRNAVRRTTRKKIDDARRAEAQTLSAPDDMAVLRAFSRLVKDQL